jgi:hypothetical protein
MKCLFGAPMEYSWQDKTKISRKRPSSYYQLIQHNCCTNWPGIDPDLRSEKPVINRLLCHGMEGLVSFWVMIYRHSVLEVARFILWKENGKCRGKIYYINFKLIFLCRPNFKKRSNLPEILYWVHSLVYYKKALHLASYSYQPIERSFVSTKDTQMRKLCLPYL